jgi:UDP-galactopyranose mutase
VRRRRRGLRHISIRCVNLGIARENITDKHWIYYPEDSIFHRIFVQGNASPHCNAPGGFGLTCEISYSPWKPLPLDGDALIAALHRRLHQGRHAAPDDKILDRQPGRHAVRLRGVRPRPRAQRGHRARWLEQHDIVLAGR